MALGDYSSEKAEPPPCLSEAQEEVSEPNREVQTSVVGDAKSIPYRRTVYSLFNRKAEDSDSVIVMTVSGGRTKVLLGWLNHLGE